MAWLALKNCQWLLQRCAGPDLPMISSWTAVVIIRGQIHNPYGVTPLRSRQRFAIYAGVVIVGGARVYPSSRFQNKMTRPVYLEFLTFSGPVITICTIRLTFTNPTFCPHSVFVCFVWISEQSAIISLYSINWLVFIAEKESVYCAVRAGSLNTILVIFRL
jgi:hypothetical protein